MKKIACVTLSGNNNFGNKLQNYALQTKIEKMGFECETLWQNSIKAENIINTLLIYLKYNILLNKKPTEREKKFTDFNKKYINYSSNIIDFYTNMKKINKKYDYFIVGSDQVWNCSMTHNYNLFFLEGIDNNKKISYSASFGTYDVREQSKKRVGKDLKKFKSISVREDAGKEIVKRIANRNDVEVLVDPTMLLTAEEWDKIAEKPKQKEIPKKYILNYFLGDISPKRKKEIDRIAKENDCKIINILDKNDPFYISGPSEFLYLEKNAFLICTDSFHSSVFAVLFNRPFIIFDREQNGIKNMNSRIDTLISKFNLKNRYYNGEYITKENLNHDYKDAYKILEKERKKSDEFLNLALNNTARYKDDFINKQIEDITRESQKELKNINKLKPKELIIKFLKNKKIMTNDKLFWPNALITYGLIMNSDIQTKMYMNKKIKEFDDALMIYIYMKNDNLFNKKNVEELSYKMYKSLERYYNKVIPYRKTMEDEIFIDILGMVPPFLCLYGLKNDNKEIINWAIMQYKEFILNGFDNQIKLPFHTYNKLTKEKKGIVGWGRSIGWILFGLSECIECLNNSKYKSEYSQLLKYYKDIFESASRYIREDGGFSWQIISKEAHLDTSATSMILMSLLTLKKKKIINEYDEYIEKILSCTIKNINDGKVINCSAECRGIGLYPQKYSSYAWSLGPTLYCLKTIKEIGMEGQINE